MLESSCQGPHNFFEENYFFSVKKENLYFNLCHPQRETEWSALYWLELPVNNVQRTKPNHMQTHRHTNSPLQRDKMQKSLSSCRFSSISYSTVLLFVPGFSVKNKKRLNIPLHYNLFMHSICFSGAVLGINTEVSG